MKPGCLLAAASLSLSVSGVQMTVTNNPYQAVNWSQPLWCVAQHHDHPGMNESRTRAYDAAGYQALSAMYYSGVASLDYSWTERKWPVYPYLGYPSDAAFLATCANLKLFIPNAEEVGYDHVTSPFLTTYIAKWEPAYYPQYTAPQPWHYTNTQDCIDTIASYGGLPSLAHPWYGPAAYYVPLRHLRAVEIYNAYGPYQERHGGPTNLTARLLPCWDALLSTNSTRIWGIAVNDWYGPWNGDVQQSDPDIWDSGKIQVLLPEYSLTAYQAAYDRGAFFAVRDNRTTVPKGPLPLVQDILVNQQSITVHFAGTVRWVGNNGVEVAQGGTLDLQTLPAGLTYVRAELSAPGVVLYVQPFSLAPGSGPTMPQLAVLAAGPGQFAFQLQGQPGVRYYLQQSTNFSSWVTFSTNTLSGSTLNVTNASTGSAKFYRALWLP